MVNIGRRPQWKQNRVRVDGQLKACTPMQNVVSMTRCGKPQHHSQSTAVNVWLDDGKPRLMCTRYNVVPKYSRPFTMVNVNKIRWCTTLFFLVYHGKLLRPLW